MLASGVCIGPFDAPYGCILRLFRRVCSSYQVGMQRVHAPIRGVSTTLSAVNVQKRPDERAHRASRTFNRGLTPIGGDG
jgi:hypothetical protein